MIRTFERIRSDEERAGPPGLVAIAQSRMKAKRERLETVPGKPYVRMFCAWRMAKGL